MFYLHKINFSRAYDYFWSWSIVECPIPVKITVKRVKTYCTLCFSNGIEIQKIYILQFIIGLQTHRMSAYGFADVMILSKSRFSFGWSMITNNCSHCTSKKKFYWCKHCRLITPSKKIYKEVYNVLVIKEEISIQLITTWWCRYHYTL